MATSTLSSRYTLFSTRGIYGTNLAPSVSPIIPIIGKFPLSGAGIGTVSGSVQGETEQIPFGYNPNVPVIATPATGGDEVPTDSPQTPTSITDLLKKNAIWLIAGLAVYFLVIE